MTAMTWAVRVVSSEVEREVVPEPSSFCSPPRSASEASGPLARVGPAREAMEALAEDLRLVEVVPLERAEALSSMTIVTRSWSCAARLSRPRSARRPEGS